MDFQNRVVLRRYSINLVITICHQYLSVASGAVCIGKLVHNKWKYILSEYVLTMEIPKDSAE